VKVEIVQHPLVLHKLTLLRDRRTESAIFRDLVEELVTLLAFEATKDLSTERVEVTTPLSNTLGTKLLSPKPVIVPILRAGLGMLEGMSRLIPSAEIGFLGMVRDEATLKNRTYTNRLPSSLTGRHCFILDPMLATGGTLISAINYLSALNVSRITVICLLATPEGLLALDKTFSDKLIDISIIIGALDEKLNENGFIVPGLGDAGDRLYGAV